MLSWLIACLLFSPGLSEGQSVRAVLLVQFALLCSASPMAGAYYWYLSVRILSDVGERSGFPGDSQLSKRKMFCALATLLLVGVAFSDRAIYRTRLVWTNLVSAPGSGTPPFRARRARDFTVAHRLAVARFPDAESCLTRSPDSLSAEYLDRIGFSYLEWIDWTEIDRDAEAEVCIFRLLASYPDISYATGWLQAQGLAVGQGFSSANPYVERDGALRVTGTWSIRRHGPKFPTHGMISRALGSIPYGMSANATWSSDGKQLLGVKIGYSTL